MLMCVLMMAIGSRRKDTSHPYKKSAVRKRHEFLTALLAPLSSPPITVLADAVNLLTETEQLLAKQQQIRLLDLLVEIDWQPYLTQLTR